MEQSEAQLSTALLDYFNGSHNFTQSDYDQLCRYTNWVMTRFSPSAARMLELRPEQIVGEVFGMFLSRFDPTRGSPLHYWKMLARSSVNSRWVKYNRKQRWSISVDVQDLIRWYETPTATYDFDKARRLFLLDWALQELAEHERLLIHRIYWKRENCRSIGLSLGVSHGTVANHHHAILRKLRVLIESMENGKKF
jgi:DNA-directed RNA polymerase specialized sigma24 family protein